MPHRPEQIVAHPAWDIDGNALPTQVYAPESDVQGMRGIYGVDGQTDGVGNQYAALAVAPHLPMVPAGAGIFYGVGTTGTQNLAMTPAPGATVIQAITGFSVSAPLASAAAAFSVTLLSLLGPSGTWWFEFSTTQPITFALSFTYPIPATAINTAIALKTVFAVASTARLDVALWGFNRAI